MNELTRTLVRKRAKNRCEYCQLRQEDSPLALHHVEHVDKPENLALACIDCNLHKGPNLTGIDPETESVTELYHPRQQIWSDHFEWNGVQLCGKTAVGRTTIRVLNMNSDDQLALRSLSQ